MDLTLNNISWLMCHEQTKAFLLKSNSDTIQTIAGRIKDNPYVPTPPLGQDMTQGQFLNSLIGLNSELSSCLTKAEERSLPYYLPIGGGRIIGFIPFPRILVLCEMQLAWSTI